MKRIAAFFLSLLLLLVICSCSTEQSGKTPNNKPAGEMALSMVPAFPVSDVIIDYNTNIDARVIMYNVSKEMWLNYIQLLADQGYVQHSAVPPEGSYERYWVRDSANGYRVFTYQGYERTKDGSRVLVTYLEINEVQALLGSMQENPYMDSLQAREQLEQWLPALPEEEWITSDSLQAMPGDDPDTEYILIHNSPFETTLTLEDYTAHRAALQQTGFTVEPEDIFEEGPFPNPNVDFYHIYRAKTQEGYTVSLQYMQFKDGRRSFIRNVYVPQEKLLADPAPTA